MLRFSKRKHVAIDYDCRQIRLVVFEYARKVPVIRSLHTASVPADVDVSDPSSMGRQLKLVVAKLGLRGAKAVMCVGRSQAVLKSLSLPPGTDPGELPSMVQFQVAQELPFGADEAVVDFTRGAHWDADRPEAVDQGTTVLAAAARLPVVDAAGQICEEAGLHLQRLGLRPYANLRAVYRCIKAKPGEHIVFVNVTAHEAEIDVMSDEDLQFSRAVTISAPGANGTPVDTGDAEARAGAVRRVVLEVIRSLDSFRAVQRGVQIHGCLVAGATGMEKELAAALADRLGVRCEQFDPSGGFEVAGGEEISGFGAALGLAAGQAGDALPFDFLNPKRPPQPRDVRKIRAAVVAAAALLLVAGFALARTIYVGKYADQADRLIDDTAKLTNTNKQLEKLQKRVEDVQGCLRADFNWLDQLAHLSNTLPGAEKVYVESVRFGAGKISFSGRAKDRESILAFKERLQSMPGYQVDSGNMEPSPDRSGYGFTFSQVVLVSAKAKPIVSTTQPAGRPPDDAAMRGQTEPQPSQTRPIRRRR